MPAPLWLVSLAVCAAALVSTATASAREIHVAKTGDDAAAGDQAHPYLSLGKAAAVAQPGDTVTVHAGTYREWVKPARGGTGEQNRITYRAAAGEEVLIKGSERITSWVQEGDGVWKAELPSTFFGDYNPYALTLSGGWLEYGQWHHRGDVYLNGEALREQQTPEAVKQKEGTWHCQVVQQTTVIRANFGRADPNRELAEINVRESVFMPLVSGLQYITVDGFHLMHSAENWEPPTIELQMGAIGPRMGKHWIIQNCRVTNARCVGIVLGHAPGVKYDDIDAFGDHVIRHNVIRRCGQAGIAGQKGATRCLVTGNLVEDTNYRKEFGGWETAAIKFHESVDTVIAGNLIRRVDYQSHGAFGIWMDWGNQGTRITGNLIYDTKEAAVFLEMDHGPILVDNNVIVGRGVRSNSEGTTFAHNLFVDCAFEMVSDTGRKSQYYRPHTRTVVERKVGIPQDDKWYNNIFIQRGLEKVKEASGYASDGNLFLEGAGKSVFGDAHSLVDPLKTGFRREETPLGVTFTFAVGKAALDLRGPRVDAALVGVLPTVKQTIEDRDGKAIAVDADMHGLNRQDRAAGPLASLKPERNTITWSLEPARPGNGKLTPHAPGAAAGPAAAKSLLVMKTYTYKTVGDLKIEADVYRPDDPQPRPVLVWLHGGALVMGAKKGVPADLMDLCRAEGYCLVSADYRLAPQVKLPEIIEDLRDFMKWVSEKGPGLFHADAGRVVVAGGSAGGYLTMMAGLLEPRAKGLVAYYGYGDVDGPWYTTPSEHYRKQALISKEEAYSGMTPEVVTESTPGPFNRSRFYLYLRQNGLWTKEVTGFDPATEKAKLDAYCPVRNITAQYPPIVMLHGTADTDVPCQESLDMAEQLKKHNVQHEMLMISGAGHGLTGGDRSAVDKAMTRAREFIKGTLGAPPAAGGSEAGQAKPAAAPPIKTETSRQ